VGTGPTTGITIANGEEAVVAWNGADFIRIANYSGPFLATTGTFSGLLTVTAGAQTTPVTATQVAGAITVNCASSNVFNTTLTASITTPTFLNPNDGQTINWFITQGGSGSYSITWSGVNTVRWAGGTAGILSTAVGAVDLAVLTYRSGPNAWYATLTKGFA
jgi:hypothetical protein